MMMTNRNTLAARPIQSRLREPGCVAYGAPGNRLQGGGRDELPGAARQHDLNLCVRLAQKSYKDWGLIRGDSARDPQQNVLSGKVHGFMVAAMAGDPNILRGAGSGAAGPAMTA